MESKHASQSRTLQFNLLVAAFAVLVDNVELLRSYLSDGNYLLLMMFVSSANIYLRSITTTPVTFKRQDKL